MKPEVVAGVENLILKRSQGLQFLGISWFGGEPLLAYDIVCRIMTTAGVQSRENGFLVSSNMTTNSSLLTRERLDKLCSLGVRHFQVSFDGSREYHDTMRLRADGAGTFDALWDRLAEVRASTSSFEYIIRIHVNEDNVTSVETLIGQLADLIKGDPRFHVWIRPLSRFGGKNDDLLPILGDSTRPWVNPGSVVERLRMQAKSRGLLLDNLVEDVCYAAKLNTFLIRADGRLGKCTVALRDGRNSFGRILPDGSLEIDSSSAAWWSRGLLSGDMDQLACPLYARP